MAKSYKKSQELLLRAEKSIPLGTQTFSKSKSQFPYGVSPYFITSGKGSRVWDVDGNEYIDFINGLDAITLGHCDQNCAKAVGCHGKRPNANPSVNFRDWPSLMPIGQSAIHRVGIKDRYGLIDS